MSPPVRTLAAPSPSFDVVHPPTSTPSVERATAPANELVAMVQKALTTFGFYHGPLSGVVDLPTQSALLTFQAQWNLQQTGTITPEVISALKIGQ